LIVAAIVFAAGLMIHGIMSRHRSAWTGHVDPELRDDARLRKHIDLDVYAAYLPEVIGQVSKSTGVRITVDSSLRLRRLTVQMDGESAGVALSGIRSLLGLEWRVSGEGSNKSYRLVYGSKSAKSEQADLKLINREMMRRAIAELTVLERALRTGDQTLLESIEYHPISPGELPMYMCDPSKWPGGPQLRSAPFLIDKQAISVLAAGKTYSRTYPQLTPRQRPFFVKLMQDNSQQPQESVVEITWSHVDTGELGLECECKTKSGSSMGSRDILVTPWKGPDYSSVSQIQSIYQTLRSMQPKYRDLRMSKPLSLRKQRGLLQIIRDLQRPPSAMPSQSVADVIGAIDNQAGLKVVSDCYTVYEDEDKYYLNIPEEVTLGEALAAMDRGLNIKWSLSGNTLYLRNRAWPYLQRMEPDPELIARLQNIIRRRGRLDLPQLAELAMLSPARFQGTDDNLRETMSQGPGLPGPDLHIGSIVSNSRTNLRLYGLLSESQRTTAATAGGLPSSQMTPQQKRYAIGCDGSNRPMPEPFTFWVVRTQATYDEMRKLVEHWARGGGGSSIANTADLAPGQRGDWVMFKIAGDMYHIEAFNLPPGK
jgi:hypothetical protein